MAHKQRNIKLYIIDIYDSIDKIIEYTSGMSLENFQTDRKTIDAVVRNFEIIGEASNQLPTSFKLIHENIEWRNLIDFRNVMIHEYFGINVEIVWDIIINELPAIHNSFLELISKIDNCELPIIWE
ncbi:MAG: DUF86 domain-containing protein [Ignavibacteriae bacterium]|nr:DUF86 domain-containing protein [Ignavibacteriota bacterium]